MIARPALSFLSRLSPFALVLAGLGSMGGCGDDGSFDVATAPDSPWPKFRRDARQTGLSAIVPTGGGALWEFPTGKGIFSSPVIGGDGTVYVGSAALLRHRRRWHRALVVRDRRDHRLVGAARRRGPGDLRVGGRPPLCPRRRHG